MRMFMFSADLYDDETVKTLINYRPYWLDENGDTGEPGDCHGEFAFFGFGFISR
jgi:hypothetical protein